MRATWIQPQYEDEKKEHKPTGIDKLINKPKRGRPKKMRKIFISGEKDWNKAMRKLRKREKNGEAN
tara:strand:- start:327 stop:524 length:198 start_codon:yes stop_codon:yes gene_type:complete